MDLRVKEETHGYFVDKIPLTKEVIEVGTCNTATRDGDHTVLKPKPRVLKKDSVTMRVPTPPPVASAVLQASYSADEGSTAHLNTEDADLKESKDNIYNYRLHLVQEFDDTGPSQRNVSHWKTGFEHSKYEMQRGLMISLEHRRQNREKAYGYSDVLAHVSKEGLCHAAQWIVSRQSSTLGPGKADLWKGCSKQIEKQEEKLAKGVKFYEKLTSYVMGMSFTDPGVQAFLPHIRQLLIDYHGVDKKLFLQVMQIWVEHPHLLHSESVWSLMHFTRQELGLSVHQMREHASCIGLNLPLEHSAARLDVTKTVELMT